MRKELQRKDIQLVVTKPITASAYFAPNRKPGDVVWVVNEAVAREVIEKGLCRLHDEYQEEPAPGTLCRRSSSWPIDRFAVVRRSWEGETVACLGGGPSLTAQDVDRCRGRVRVIAINNAYELAPWAEVCYFADFRWWEWHKEKPAFKDFAGEKVTIWPTGMSVPDPRVWMLQNCAQIERRDALSREPNALQTGSNSGYQAINIAVLAGAKRILLLGYDMKFTAGKSHWHAGHPIKDTEQLYSGYAGRFNALVEPLKSLGVEVINCTPGSAVKAFPIRPLESVFAPPA